MVGGGGGGFRFKANNKLGHFCVRDIKTKIIMDVTLRKKKAK